MKDLYDLLQIKSNASTAFHPQINGQTKRVNQKVEKYLCIFINYLQTDWVEWLTLTAFAHNNQIHLVTSKSPFEINYGLNIHVLSETKPQTPFQTPASHTFILKMQEIHAKAKQALEKAADQMKIQYDKNKWLAVKYSWGDKVWLDTTNLHCSHPKKKLTDKQTGPFKIIVKKEASAYTLKLPTNWHVHPMFNEALLTPYTQPAFPNQEQPPSPPPDLINSTEYYEVEKVLNSRLHKVRGRQGEPSRRVTNYFVKWKGYGLESNSWVWEDSMDANKLVEEFLVEHIDLVITDIPQATIIIDGQHKDGYTFGPKDEWQYLIQPANHPMYGPTVWYYAKEVPSYAQLIEKYWEEN